MSKLLIIAAVVLLAGNGILFFMILKVHKVRALVGRYLYSSQPFLLLGAGMGGILAAVFFSLFYFGDVMPYNTSVHGRTVDHIFMTTLGLTGFIFLLTQGLLFYFPFRYRTGKDRQAYYYKRNVKIEILWMGVPFLTFAFLFIWGQTLWNKIQTPGWERPLEIEVVAEQFNWRIRYPGKDGKFGIYNYRLIDPVNDLGLDFRDRRNHDDVQPFQLHVPKNRKIRVRLRSRDVIHSFYIPQMRTKMDAVPGITTEAHFIPTHSTDEMREYYRNPDFNYEVACAELCGRMHFAMKLILVVDEPEDFEKWYEAQTPWLTDHPEYEQGMHAEANNNF